LLTLSFTAAAFVGLAAAPLWTSKCSYLTDTGSIYALEKGRDQNAVINRFFGIFFMFSQSGLSFMPSSYTISLFYFILFFPSHSSNLGQSYIIFGAYTRR
jgi:hypothetical protein